MSGSCLRVLVDGPRGPAANMAIDEALQRRVAAGASGPVLRFYRWDPPSLSFGYAQSIAHLVDPAAAVAAGIGLVRRMTGGRVVFHGDEWTFSLVVPLPWLDRALAGREDQTADPNDQEAGGEPAFLQRFRALIAPLVTGLQAMGLAARFATDREVRANLGGHPAAASGRGVHCYQAAAGHSIYVGGRKLVGAAGVVREGVMAVHGSLPIHPVELPVEIWRDPAVGRAWHELNVAWLGDLLPAPERETLPHRLASSWSESWGIPFVIDRLADPEEQLAARLAVARYDRLDWKINEPGWADQEALLAPLSRLPEGAS
ncbi:MAG: Lipoate-protein ligase A [Candidatus Ozemobacter sibiricus]|uniref:Lipoate-protein ligase A n=1 Tax=Candidatus Ozemobacter sibiricus TaxID=2268124 RepID=A0A367ZKR9_9BACT|nr:MAG: Lipoate-protein ligase A [Candidatus Ozemobacter sibiricus]